jgi:hypothetical protein
MPSSDKQAVARTVLEALAGDPAIVPALKTVTLTSGKSQPEALALIEAFQQLFFADIPLDYDNLSTISPAELAEVVTGGRAESPPIHRWG